MSRMEANLTVLASQSTITSLLLISLLSSLEFTRVVTYLHWRQLMCRLEALPDKLSRLRAEGRRNHAQQRAASVGSASVLGVAENKW
jgi:hypothetical protein